ncbi:hypothetical protein J7F03_16305 [Streptomyces sp. ISL-43]|uniref:hypothetical protein n=1 Tax=Streptomyces sp. ISL-43 TaxID=2819183 RepID=UPI001BEACAE4|nr:hypothetical protein [Streptomyces sp. ISL-43]MBT2448624.1 hypothetical protein [Streptomyces sp. ISL-43]
MEQSERRNGEGEAPAPAPAAAAVAAAGGIQLPAVAWAEEEPDGPAGTSAEPEAEAEAVAESEAESAPPGTPRVLPAPPGPASPEAATGAATEADPEGDPEGETEADPETEAEPESAASPSPVLGEFVAAIAAPESAAGGASTGQGVGRIPKPVVAAALVGGLVLIGLPLVLSQLGGGGPARGSDAPPPAGMNRPAGGPEGFVPGFDDRGNPVPPQGLQGGAPSPGQGDPNSAGGAQGGYTNAENAGGAGLGGSSAQSGAGSPGGTGSNGSGGSGGGGGTPTSGDGGAGRPPAPDPAPPAAAKTYQAVAGAGCSDSGTGYSQHGWFDNGQAGWKTYSSGGWSGNGCKGSFTAIPMSGAAGEDNGNYALWTFRTGPVTSGRCKVSVYIPNNKDIKAVGGSPAYYTVQNSLSPGSGTIDSFVINQRSTYGSWVDGGTYDVRNGQLAVKLHDRGQDWVGNTKTYAHDAASAVRVSCTA